MLRVLGQYYGRGSSCRPSLLTTIAPGAAMKRARMYGGSADAPGEVIGKVTLGNVSREIVQPRDPALVPVRYVEDSHGTALINSQEVRRNSAGSQAS